jgi:hypothetical protein
LLIDESREAYRAAGLRRASLLDLFHPLNRAARGRARRAGHRQHRLGRDPFQLGGTFVLAPGDSDIFVRSSETFGDNPDPTGIESAIANDPRLGGAAGIGTGEVI